ncbi:IS701 family transposase [Deinococcus sp. HMF7620]|uniref:IS701 family transposase n=1 Tax=Deinococcus arboris TaxID=2682977 RepID=A0A7C9MSQ1_9DEIO|nr:IS701 family transposase [Deinococcus arboris]MVN88244.1 IS701 family transposase [Deinococcus arboris]
MLALLFKRSLLPRWTQHFPTWFSPFLTSFRHQAQRFWASTYIQGLCSAAHRKSMQPLANQIARGQHDQIQHLITDSPWGIQGLEQLVVERAQPLAGGKKAVLIIDDTCLTKFGSKSVGVGRQYSGQAGKSTNCQCLVSVTLARNEIPIPLRLKLFLPSEWSSDQARCLRAGVPAEHLPQSTKWEIALREIDDLTGTIQYGMVLADAGYGVNAAFRRGLTARGLRWSVGTIKTQRVYPAHVRLIPIPKHFRGRPPRHPTPSEETESIESVLSQEAWRRVMWRHGTKGPLIGTFAATYVRLADGNENARGQHLPGEGAWIIGEQRARGEKKYDLCNLPPETAFKHLIQITKQRWACELGHRELKQEVGLSHFEGRSWQSLHRHAVLCLVALLFLQWLRLSQPDDLFGETVPAIQYLSSILFVLHSTIQRTVNFPKVQLVHCPTQIEG